MYLSFSDTANLSVPILYRIIDSLSSDYREDFKGSGVMDLQSTWATKKPVGGALCGAGWCIGSVYAVAAVLGRSVRFLLWRRSHRAFGLLTGRRSVAQLLTWSGWMSVIASIHVCPSANSQAIASCRLAGFLLPASRLACLTTSTIRVLIAWVWSGFIVCLYLSMLLLSSWAGLAWGFVRGFVVWLVVDLRCGPGRLGVVVVGSFMFRSG
jgi:hypothetical protein